MAKQRKTRKQKQLADSRHPVQSPLTTSHNANGSYSYTFTAPSTQRVVPGRVTIALVTNQFILQDLRKTLLTTLAIIVAQLVLLFVFKK